MFYNTSIQRLQTNCTALVKLNEHLLAREKTNPSWPTPKQNYWRQSRTMEPTP